MTKKKLDELLTGEDLSELVKALSVTPKVTPSKYAGTTKALTPLDEYNVEEHPVFDKIARPDKVGTGDPTQLKLNRIGLAIEAYIASRASAFLCGLPIKYMATPEGEAEERMWEAVKRVNENNKLDFKNQGILEMRMSELKTGEIWYLQPLDEDDDFWQGTTIQATQGPRLFLAAPSLNDKLWPVWDNGILIAFGREWVEAGDEGKDIRHFDLYTKEKIYELIETGGTWQTAEQQDAEEPATIGKLPVIYHYQSEVEWAKVRAIIRRLENIYSNFADSNDRFAFPWLLVEGGTKSIPQGVSDKIMELQNGAKASFLTPPNAPEAIKLEVEQLWRELHRLTDTVDITNDSLSSLGQTTGPALEFRFMPAHLKASKHAGTFGECIQRRINLIKAMCVACDPTLKEGLTLQIKPQFDYFLPKDFAGLVNYLTTATTGNILSKETATAILQSAFGGDGKAEFDKIQAQPQPDQLGNVFSTLR